MTSKLLQWFETHELKVSVSTLYYRNLDMVRKDLIASKVALPPNNEIVICSFFDDNNFLLVGDRYLVWHSDTDGGSVPLQNVEMFHRKGDLGDDRYAERKTRLYHDGTVKELEEIAPNTKLPSYFVCDASPMVFIKESGGRYYDFKVEPGRQIDTIWMGIFSGKRFLACEQQ